MPSSPKILDIRSKEGQIEIDENIKSHHFPQPPCDVGIPIEITKHLEDEGVGSNENNRARVRRVGCKDGIDDIGEAVGNKHFLEESPRYEINSLKNFSRSDLAGRKDLRKKVPCTFNGTR